MLIYFVVCLGLANVLAEHSNYIQDTKFDISEENIPIEDTFNINNNIKIDLKRERRYARNNVYYKKNNTVTSYNNIPRYNYTNNNLQRSNFVTQNNGNGTNVYNTWMNNNVTRNNDNGFTNWNNIARYNNNNGAIPGSNGNRYPGYVSFTNTTFNGYPGNNPTYGPKTPVYNGNKIPNTTPQFYYPAQNYNGNGTRPGYNGIGLNNTKPGYNNFNYTPIYPTLYPKPGNNTGFNGIPPGYMPYTGNNTRYFAPNNTTPSFNYKPVTITPGYIPKPGTNSSVPAVTFNNGNIAFNNGNSTINCNRCSKKDIAMNACAILCNDCPEGMRRVGGVCVSVSSDPDEDY